MSNIRSKKAFTLSEVLITLGIIGVVSALTLPSVVINYKNRVYVAQLQRTCNILSTAASRLMKDEEVDDMIYTSLFIDDASVAAAKAAQEDFFKKYFKVTHLCGYENKNKECLGAVYKGLNKNNGFFPEPGKQYCAKVDTGAVVCINGYGLSSNDYANVSIDVNGAKGPNILGRDAFNLILDRKGSLKESAHNGSRHAKCGVSHVEYGAGCFDKIVKDGWKMDY